jgi:hypothetical protein
MAQQPLVGQGLLIIKASRSHSDTPHSVGLPWTSNQPIAETSTWQHTTLTTDRHPCPPAGFEPTIPASERPQTHALDSTAIGIGHIVICHNIIRVQPVGYSKTILSLSTVCIASMIKVNQQCKLKTGYSSVLEIQCNSVEKVNILGGCNIGHWEKRLHMDMCLILNDHQDKVVWISRSNSVRFLFVALDEERSLQNKGGYTDELLARILYAAACIKKREDQLRRTTRDLRTRVAKCVEVYSGIFENLFWTVTNLSFLVTNLSFKN